MNAEITEIIKRSLPQQVGEVLQARLAKADADELSLARANERIAKQSGEIASMQALISEANAVKGREAALREAEAKLIAKQIEADKNAAVLAVRDQMTKAMIEQNLQVVLAVFANNKMKYQESSMVPFAAPPSYQGGPPQIATGMGSRTVETQQ